MAKGRKMSGAKKFFVGLLVVVLLVVGICVALYITIPEAKDKMNDVFASIANVFKSEEAKNSDRKENAHLDD